MLFIYKVSYLELTCFGSHSLDHHQVLSLYRGNHTIYGMIQYENIKLLRFNEI